MIVVGSLTLSLLVLVSPPPDTFATLVTLGDDGLTANHIPFVLETRAGAYGRLLGHVARNNTVWQDHDPDMEALVVFQSNEAYITPNWYATKRETHEAFPIAALGFRRCG